MDSSIGDVIEISAQIPDTANAESGQTIAKLTSIFSNMCTRLTLSIAQQRIIQERTLLDFNKMVIWTIKNNITELPNSFDELTGHVSDYWHYELNEESNSERKYSYIRLYQMVNTINTFYAERNLQDKALLALEQNSQNIVAIRLIQQSPGITHKRLREILDIPSSTLRDQLDALEKGGFLSGRRSGDERYYMLTNAGDVLYQTLIARQKHDVSADEWSSERTQVFCFILERLQNQSIQSIPVLRVMRIVSALDDSLIAELNKRIGQGRYEFPWEKLNRRMRNSMMHTHNGIEYKYPSPTVAEMKHFIPFISINAYKPCPKMESKILHPKTIFSVDSGDYLKQLDIYENIGSK